MTVDPNQDVSTNKRLISGNMNVSNGELVLYSQTPINNTIPDSFTISHDNEGLKFSGTLAMHPIEIPHLPLKPKDTPNNPKDTGLIPLSWKLMELNMERLLLDTRSLIINGDIQAGNSDIYFTKTDHDHTGFGNKEGYAAIENAANYNALMILGRSIYKDGKLEKRIVSLWDYLKVNGGMDVTGNVGIGTDKPSGKLDVRGDIQAGNSDIYFTKTDHNHTGFGNKNGYAAIENDGKKYNALMILGRQTPNGRIVSLWDYLKVNGKLDVTGDIQAHDVVLAGGDCAEDFDIATVESVQPGTVMVIDKDGALKPSHKAFDKRVAGVVSGAGDLRPGITLDRQKERANRLPIALTGKVYCKVDAEYDRVEVGDLLTTSETPGHAMKASDPTKSFGAVIGKALKPLKVGQDMIPILVALQ